MYMYLLFSLLNKVKCYIPWNIFYYWVRKYNCIYSETYSYVRKLISIKKKRNKILTDNSFTKNDDNVLVKLPIIYIYGVHENIKW